MNQNQSNNQNWQGWPSGLTGQSSGSLNQYAGLNNAFQQALGGNMMGQQSIMDQQQVPYVMEIEYIDLDSPWTCQSKSQLHLLDKMWEAKVQEFIDYIGNVNPKLKAQMDLKFKYISDEQYQCIINLMETK